MKKVLNFAIFMLLGLFCPDAKADEPETNHSSYIYISGKTNVNAFKFRQDNVFLAFGDSPFGKSYVRITIPVKHFETDNPGMYTDFVDLLKANQHPYIFIDLLRADFNALHEGQFVEQSVRFHLTIAGVTKLYHVNSQIHTLPNDCFTLKGNRAIKLPDFDIEPPEKFFGMIKVNDEVEIDFNLSLCMKKGAMDVAKK